MSREAWVQTQDPDAEVAGELEMEPGMTEQTLPGDMTEGAPRSQVTLAGDRGTQPQRQPEFDQRMRDLEAARGEGSAGAIGDVVIGTPAGATSDALRNREAVPQGTGQEKGQQKDRQPGNEGSGPA